ncbi:myb-like protein L, partial [Trichonephila clavata]
RKLEVIGKETKAVQNKCDGKTRRSKPISLFAAPFFRDIKDMHPPDNEDTSAKQRNKDVTAYLQLPKPWIKCELDKLSQGVLESAMEILLKPFKEKETYYKDKMKNLDGSERKRVKLLLKETIEKRKKESQRPRAEIVKEVQHRIDWMQVAVRYLESARSDDECEAMWNNYASIFISKLPFSPEEDDRLSKLVKKYNGRNWDAIAEEMSGRSAIQCLERYQTRLNKAFIKKYWTPEEDKKLMDVVDSLKVGKFIPWNKVVSYMEGRERHQIINRYQRTINTELKRTPWTKEEDAMLLACVSKFGSHWCKMMEFFPGRNAYTLRERYVNVLDPNLKFVQWTKKEDQNLISLIKKYGFGKWSKISKEMNGRTDNNCLIRAKYLGIKPITNKNAKSSDPIGIKILKGKCTRQTHQRNNSRLPIQLEARKTLQEALKKVVSSVDENIDFKTLDLSSITMTALRELHAELKKNEGSCKKTAWTPRYLSSDGVNKKDFSKSRKKRKIEIETASEEEREKTDEDVCDSDGEKEFDDFEEVWLQEILCAKFEEAAGIPKMPAYTKCFKYSSRETTEFSIYEEYLKQKLMCSLNHEEEDLNLVFKGIDYNVSIADIVSHFVQPPASEDNPMIFAPNWTTLTGMDMLQSTDSSLRKTAKFVDHNKAYIGYLIGYTNNPPKCIKCCNAENTKTCKETFDVVLNAMKSSLILPDEEIKQAVMVETRQSDVQGENCCCDALANSANAVHLLTHRFISLFLWPFLLATLKLTEKQEELVFTKKYIPKYKKINDHVKQPAKRRAKHPAKRRAKHPANNKRIKKNNIKNNIKKPVENHFLPSTSTQPLRRSRRSCVLQRRSFSFYEDADENDAKDNSDEDFTIDDCMNEENSF